ETAKAPHPREPFFLSCSPISWRPITYGMGIYRQQPAFLPISEYRAGTQVSCGRCLIVHSCTAAYHCCTQVLETEKAGNPHGDMSSIDSELRDDRCDVVVLFLRAESPNLIHDCGQQSLAR